MAMRFLLLMALCAAAAGPGAAALGGAGLQAQAAQQQVRFRGSCPNPPGTLGRSGGGYVVTLRHGAVGGCASDKRPRHSAPYWERSELRSTDFAKGPTYRFEVDVKFDPETRSSDRTTFFQIHQYRKTTCERCYPAVMLKAHGDGTIHAAILATSTNHRVVQLGLSRAAIAGRWARFSILLGTGGGMQPVTILLDGRKLYSGRALIEPGGAIFMKTGLYRPGSVSGALPTDRLWLRNIRYSVQ